MAKLGRPKAENPKTFRLELMVNEEENNRVKKYASEHNMTIASVLRKGILLQYEMDDPARGKS